MSDLISRQAAIDAFFVELCFNKKREYAIGYKGIEKIINRLPSAEKTGRWLDVENDIDYYPFMCSECHETVIKRTNYCPQCGARMVN